MRIRLAFASVLLACGATTAAPQVFTVNFDFIADSQTLLPDDPVFHFGGFSGSSLYKTNSGLIFANSPIIPFSKPGLFRYSANKIQTIAVSGKAPFEDGALVDHVYSNGGNTVFRTLMNTIESPVSSIWINKGGVNENLVPINAELPDGAGTAINLDSPRVNGADVLFAATGSDGQSRIYRTSIDGAPFETLIADSPNTLFPGDSLDIGDFQGDHFVFRTRDHGIGTGVFAADLDGNTIEIANIGDPVPGHEGESTFGAFGGLTTHPSMEDGRVVFVAEGTGGINGVYTTTITDNTLETVVDNTMELPNDNGLTFRFGAPSISGDNIAFFGIGADGTGVGAYVSIAGTIVDIIHLGDTLDGRIVNFISSGSFAFNNNTLAFSITFTDSSRGLYLATVTPAPGSACCLALGGAWAARRRRMAG